MLYKLILLASVSLFATAITCPDGQSFCPDGNTCCKLRTGEYGCCPLPQAVCCKDGLHCCPHATTCDTAHGKCNQQGNDNSPANILIQKLSPGVVTSKQPIRKIGASIRGSETCKGTPYKCDAGQTCCPVSAGLYGCCPAPNAVCCNDHRHCCPAGTTCDVSGGKCNHQAGIRTAQYEFLELTKKSVSILRQDTTTESVQCPDGQSFCGNGQTCCKLPSGEYGCCPMPNAVCCSDHLHCCPHNTRCNLGAGTCDQGTGSIKWALKQPSRRIPDRDVV